MAAEATMVIADVLFCFVWYVCVCFYFTHVAGIQGRSGMESEDSWEGIPSVRYSGKPFRCWGPHTGFGLDRRRAGSRWEAVEDGHRCRTQREGHPVMGQRSQERPPGRPGLLGQQLVPVLPRPCVGTLPPSYGPSIPCGSP